ncbi:Patatin-like phospholipase domain-containing protein 3 [Tetrabaena socialis]|uniref:Patatin n=1 Tax=Tetrabaena socialis TaxID=47790 RepID=A0A2J8AJT8_9CHLO|nr:Patatin-like phospholipase domain-containing protein 3 [Tetrabaena socialis]|eukprot:PNH12778.1 Patatin-like phospholipase domain-containing protein 3 [Tetrabaena socialis]
MDVLRPETPVAGASAGSIIAVCAKSGLSEEKLLEAFLDLAQDCRAGGTRGRLKFVLRRVLEAALPEDIHLRCEGTAFLAVTRLWPDFQPQTISSFRSRRDLIDTLLVSCHIPYWFDGSLFTLYRGGLFFDGGITNFIPTTPTEVCHRVCCFPAQQMRAFPNIDLSPDTYEPWPHDMRTMLSWAFEPAPEAMLLELVGKGKRDARAWAAANAPTRRGLLVAAAGGAGASGAAGEP